MSQLKFAQRNPGDGHNSGQNRTKVQQLQELFPTMSSDDLNSVLNDCNGDVQQAANRISEGNVEHWDSVSRKKDKKPGFTQSQSHSKDGFSSRGRGDSRGARGGRGGGRGGIRGGAPRGGRGGGPNGRASPVPPHGSSHAYPDPNPPPGNGFGDVWTNVTVPAEEHTDLAAEKLEHDGWGEDRPSEVETAQSIAPPNGLNGPPKLAPFSKGRIPGPVQPAAKTWAQVAGHKEKAAPPPVVHQAPPSESPAINTTVASTQTSSAPPLLPSQASALPDSQSQHQHEPEEPTTVEAPTWDDEPPTVSKKVVEEPVPEPESVPEPSSAPHSPVPEPKPEEPKVKSDEPEATSVPEPAKLPSALPTQLQQQQPTHQAQPQPQHAAPVPSIAAPTSAPALQSSDQRQFTPPIPSHTPSGRSRANRYKMADQQAVVLPSGYVGQAEKMGMMFGSVTLGGDDFDSEPAAAAVAEPEAAPAIERKEVVQQKPQTKAQAAPAPQQHEPSQQPRLQAPPSVPTPTAPQIAQQHQPESSKAEYLETPTSAPAPSSASLSSSSLFQNLTQHPQPAQVASQQVLAQHQQHHVQQRETREQQQQREQQQHAQQQLTPPQASQATHGLASSASQPALQTASASPIQQFAQQSHAVSQQSLSSHHQHQQQHQHHQHPAHQAQHQHQQQQHQQQQQQYAQHGLSSHADPGQQQQQGALHSSYFRQAEQPYFHAATPPAGQAQEQPYGTFGGLAGQGALGGFGAGAGEYSYADTQRGFYESYAQSGIGGRNVLGHDDVKSLPGSQTQSSNSLPSSSSQSSQQHTSGPQTPQSATSSAGQGGPQQQSYHTPLPYYYQPYTPGQYYGNPYNTGYGVGMGVGGVHQPPYVKFPGMYQGPPGGQGSSPSPVTKQPPSLGGVSVSQSNPYASGGLYGQGHHPSASYDDIHYQPLQAHQHPLQNLPQHGQGAAGSLPSDGYGKQQQHQQQQQRQQLYAAQGFMGLGQGAGGGNGGPGGGGPTLAQRAGGTSPDTPYKPYGIPGMSGVKDVTGGGGTVGGQGQGNAQGRGNAQGGFYGGNRFGGGSAAGNGPQGGGHQSGSGGQQQHGGPQAGVGPLGYPQGAADASFYSYQPRQQQQGYWQ